MEPAKHFASDRRAVAFGRAGDRRQIRRSKIFTPVTLTTGQQVLRAHMLDIGQAGALCFSDTLQTRGSIVEVCWRTSNWVAQVIWVKDNRFGLRFLSTLHADIVQSVIDNV